MKRLLFFLFVLLYASSVLAVVEHGEMKIYAVTTEGQGLAADLVLDLDPGTGKVWTSVEPLVGTTTQNAAREAVNLARNYSGQVSSFDYKFSIASNASLVEGPSAGAAMSLLVISMLQSKVLPSNVSLTGTISSDGFVGPVGGVFEKTAEAANTGIKLFMIPKGEAIQTVKIDGKVQSINLVDYAPKEFGLKVVEVSTIDEVLKYAFSDIEEIDINQTAEEAVPDFVPQEITYKPNLGVMKELTSNYLKETKAIIESARTSLSTTLLEDTSLVNTLLDTLNDAEQTIRQAEILNDQNYLYSAANFAFLARVNAMIVRDISDNPSILALNSTVLELKLDILRKDIENLRMDLDKSVPIDFFEWHVSAQQRLTYAEINVERLLNTQTIVVDTGNGTDLGAVFEKIRDYEFAAAWYDVSKDFYEITRQSVKRVRKTDAFKEMADSLIVEAENSVTLLTSGDKEDIVRRLNAAKVERELGWNAASAFDSASAKALASSEVAVEGKNVEGLYSELEQRINVLEQKILSSSFDFAWPVLYLDHAKFFLASANYYKELNQGTQAVNSLKNGIGLVSLAEEVFEAASPMYERFASLDESEIIEADNGLSAPAPSQSNIFDSPLMLGVLVMFSGAVFLFGIVLTITILRGEKRFSIASEMQSVKELQRKADTAFTAGKISEEKHAELANRYAAELASLESLRARRVKTLLEIEENEAEVEALKTRLRELNAHLRDGLLSKGEFKKRSAVLEKRISELHGMGWKESLELEREKQEMGQLKKGVQKTSKPAASKKQSFAPKKPYALKQKPQYKETALKAAKQAGKTGKAPAKKKPFVQPEQSA
ncbi:MAG: hypothetical protein J4224_01380 [Candidatus Diapherotrites archaeon]|uniref:Lon proteolytic domain-containing protein n=1 Tax=Candidatus Iainarchaeum sp. TaxID=3101447 RepID=A0A8T4L7Y9_9ARCH|nr:hypothetical protein [Candidatus Diapherotrites archaeon]